MRSFGHMPCLARGMSEDRSTSIYNQLYVVDSLVLGNHSKFLSSILLYVVTAALIYSHIWNCRGVVKSQYCALLVIVVFFHFCFCRSSYKLFCCEVDNKVHSFM